MEQAGCTAGGKGSKATGAWKNARDVTSRSEWRPATQGIDGADFVLICGLALRLAEGAAALVPHEQIQLPEYRGGTRAAGLVAGAV